MTLDFGKYRGKPLAEVPTSYIEWCLEEMAYMKTHVRKAMEDELALREEEEQLQSADRFMEERRC